MAKRVKNETAVINSMAGDDWMLYHGDCVEVLKGLPDNSIDFCVYSPPFSQLYVYSASAHDHGNVRSHEEFFDGYRYLVRELLRVVKPGSNVSVHSMILPTSKQRDGFIGLYDFPGDIRKCHQEEGFIFHSEVVIRKDPVTAMQRTKAIGLLHKQLTKDSSMSRQAIPDYLTTFRKPGERSKPVAGHLEYYAGDLGNKPAASGRSDRDSINIWQRYAEPVFADISSRFQEILPTLNPEQAELFYQLLNYQAAGTTQQQWMDINPSDTLQYQSARANNDERHIAPLQLQVIERAIQLWSNPGEVVLTPYAGIGSELYQAVKMGRKAIGAELKESYFNCAVNNLQSLEALKQQMKLFDLPQESIA